MAHADDLVRILKEAAAASKDGAKMKKLRIAIFEPTRVQPGGGQKVMPYVAAHLAEKHDVTVFAQAATQGGLTYGKSKVKIIRPSCIYLSYLAFLFQKIKKENFDIVIYGCFPAPFAVFRNEGIPCIHITHSPLRVFYDLRNYLFKNSNFSGKLKILIKNILFKKLDYIAVRKIDKVLGISLTVQKRVNKFYKRDADFFHLGINPKDYKSGKYENYLLAPGRLEINKRPEEIVKAMGFVKNKNIKLLIVGSGNMSQEIKEMSKNYSNVEFRGFVSKDELQRLYSNCLAVIYIPVNEDYGYVPVEAAGSGKATIGVNEGGLRETIIDGKTGFLIDKVTPEKLAEKINFFANHPKIAIKMGKAAKEHSKKFYWENSFKILDKAIEEVIKNFR